MRRLLVGAVHPVVTRGPGPVVRPRSRGGRWRCDGGAGGSVVADGGGVAGGATVPYRLGVGSVRVEAVAVGPSEMAYWIGVMCFIALMLWAGRVPLALLVEAIREWMS